MVHGSSRTGTCTGSAEEHGAGLWSSGGCWVVVFIWRGGGAALVGVGGHSATARAFVTPARGDVLALAGIGAGRYAAATGTLAVAFQVFVALGLKC